MLQEQLVLPIGAVIQDRNGERYIIEDLLGTGGFSAVYLIREKRGRQRQFALKEMIDPDNQERGHLAFEAELLRRLDHRSLPHVYQVFENSEFNRIYMLMDYIEGNDLEVLRREQPEKRFSLALTLALMTPIVEAIHYLHTRPAPVVHRDIKPSNIIIPVGTGDAMLVDFGLAKEYIENKTTNVFRYGTPGYAAPEQYGQGTNPRTDIYALGATLYTLLTGKIPVDALTRSVEKYEQDPFEPAHIICPAIPLQVSQVISKAMSLRVEERYNNVEEFWQALSMAVIQPVSGLVKPPATTPFPPTLSADDMKILATTKLLADSEKKGNTPRPTSIRPRPRIYLYNKKKSSMPLKIFLSLLFLIIVGMGADILLFTNILKNNTPATASKTPTVASETKISCQTLMLAGATEQIKPGNDYPSLAPCYEGHIQNETLNRYTNMFLYDIRQNQGKISGKFQGMGLYGAFSGTIDRQGNISFQISIKSTGETYQFSAGPYIDQYSGHFIAINSHGEQTGSGIWVVNLPQ